MNGIDKDKYKDILKKRYGDNKEKKGKFLKGLLSRILIVGVIVLTLMIVYKSNSSFKEKVDNIINDKGISFSKINKVYNKYLKGLLPLKKEEDTLLAEEVFDEKISYQNIDYYYDGVSLEVSNNYLVPNINEGMVIFAGKNELYGDTVIIEDLDGIDILYGNISNTSLKLYDYVKKGEIIGEADKKLYLTFNKDGNYLAYENFLS